MSLEGGTYGGFPIKFLVLVVCTLDTYIAFKNVSNFIFLNRKLFSENTL